MEEEEGRNRQSLDPKMQRAEHGMHVRSKRVSTEEAREPKPTECINVEWTGYEMLCK
jgi:hypothetical protein